jgi:hypothetical protein
MDKKKYKRIKFKAELATGWHILPGLSFYWYVNTPPGKYMITGGIFCFNFRIYLDFRKNHE